MLVAAPPRFRNVNVRIMADQEREPFFVPFHVKNRDVISRPQIAGLQWVPRHLALDLARVQASCCLPSQLVARCDRLCEVQYILLSTIIDASVPDCATDVCI